MPYPIEDAVPAGFGTTAIEEGVPYGPPPDRPLAHAPAGGSQIPRRKGVWFALASVTALVVLAPTAGQVYGWMFRQSSDSSWSQAHPITAVRVNVASGDVRIDPGSAGQARVGESLSWVLHKPSVRESWAGDTLVVTATCDNNAFPLPDQCSVDLDITVPAAAAVTVAATSGEVTATGMTGGVHMETDSGDIQLSGISGAVFAHAVSGSITAQSLTSIDADVQVESGSVDLDFAAVPQRVVSRVVSGDTSIFVPRGDGYLITAQSLSGGRDIDPALQNGQSTHLISADSDSGNVSIHAQG